MVNKQKQKGDGWERDLVKYLNTTVKGAKFKRVPGSGAMGTALHEPLLTADVVGKVEGLERSLKIECKIGYGGAKQFTLKKEWLDKVSKEASATYSIPFLAGRFSGSRSGVENFVVFDLDEFCDLLNLIGSMGKELESLYEKLSLES